MCLNDTTGFAVAIFHPNEVGDQASIFLKYEQHVFHTQVYSIKLSESNGNPPCLVY